MLDLDSLIAYYQQGIDDAKNDLDRKDKYQDMLKKHQLLINFKNS